MGDGSEPEAFVEPKIEGSMVGWSPGLEGSGKSEFETVVEPKIEGARILHSFYVWVSKVVGGSRILKFRGHLI